MLLSRRPNDVSNHGFANWTLATVHLWGEQPTGTWMLMVRDKASLESLSLFASSRTSLFSSLHTSPSFSIERSQPRRPRARRHLNSARHQGDTQASEALQNLQRRGFNTARARSRRGRPSTATCRTHLSQHFVFSSPGIRRRRRLRSEQHEQQSQSHSEQLTASQLE